MEGDRLLGSLDTLVKRLIELSPTLDRPVSQWQSKLKIFIEAIKGKKTLSDCNDWVAGVKALAADVKEILNEIAGNQPVNDDLRTRIDRASSQMDTLNARRSEIGLKVLSDSLLTASGNEIGNLEDYIEIF